MIEAQTLTTSGTTATFSFNDHPQRRGNFFGGFWVKLPTTTTTTTTAAYNVEFATLGVLGSNLPLYLFNGTQAKLGAVAAGGVMLCFYDRTTNRLQAIGVQPAASS